MLYSLHILHALPAKRKEKKRKEPQNKQNSSIALPLPMGHEWCAFRRARYTMSMNWLSYHIFKLIRYDGKSNWTQDYQIILHTIQAINVRGQWALHLFGQVSPISQIIRASTEPTFPHTLVTHIEKIAVPCAINASNRACLE